MTQFYQLGGAERLQVELAEELNIRGIHTDILSMYSEGLLGVAEAKQDLLGRGVNNIYFLDMKVHPPFDSLLPAIIKLKRLIRGQKYDIVETSSISTNVIASWATLNGRTRHVVGLHHVFMRNRENTRRHMFWRFTLRYNRRNRYYAISNYVNNAWQSYSNISGQYIRTICNAIQNDFFTAKKDRSRLCKELEIPSDGHILLYVGRLAKYKGCDILLEAIAPCLRQNNLFLLYVGLVDPAVSGSDEMLANMNKKISSENLGERVRFLGYRKDIPRLMSSADVLVHSTTTEGFGLTLVEAMAAGLPVVATNVEGIPEVLAGTDSIMVPPNDPYAIRDAILKTLNRSSEEACSALKKGKNAAENFRIDKRVDQFVNFFENILAERF